VCGEAVLLMRDGTGIFSEFPDPELKNLDIPLKRRKGKMRKLEL
jgi:hypothetical protein